MKRLIHKQWKKKLYKQSTTHKYDAIKRRKEGKRKKDGVSDARQR